ncbi:MAG: hypothetical protein IT210_05350 [Armatimonadetes bacterium]|nr:hypothetical protein [Armatimonadota bacterium]
MADIPSGSPLRAAPRLLDAPTGKLPKARKVGTPAVRTLLGYTRRILRLHDGHTLGVFSFSSGGAKANWLFLIDSRTLAARRYPIPNNDIASHGAALGKDGDIYIMPYGNGRAYRFRVGPRRFEPIETGLPRGEYTWEAFGASNGCIYFGTYPNAYLGEYDPSTGKCTLYRQAAPNTKYTTYFAEDSQGRIRFKAWGPDEVWMAFDPKTKALKPESPDPAPSFTPFTLPAAPEGDSSYSIRLTAIGRHFALSFPSCRFWEVKEGEAQPVFRGDPESPGETWWYLENVPGAVVGISYFGTVFRYDLKSGAFRHRRLPNKAPGGNNIMFLETVSPRCVIGANYSQQNLFTVDPETGATRTSEEMVARVTGEPMCAVGLGGKAYVGIYVLSILSVYDPEQPFAFGKNPREIIELGEKYHQTRPRDAATDGSLVFISSDSDYNYLGGALAVIDPATGKVDVYHHLIRDQNLPTLAYDPHHRLLWGGTDRWGQMRSHPPTQESALIYAFDPATRQVAATLTPWPGADAVSVLGLSDGGILIASSAGEIALIDTDTRAVLYQGASPVGVPGKVRQGSDGFSYCLAGGRLLRWDLSRNALTPVAEAPGCYYLTETSPGTWVMADSVSVYRVKVRPFDKSKGGSR